MEENPHLATKEFEDQISITCDSSKQKPFIVVFK